MKDIHQQANGTPELTCDPVLVATLAESLIHFFGKLMEKESFVILADQEDLESLFDLMSQTKDAADNFLGVNDIPL
jgi:hypothetical protein